MAYSEPCFVLEPSVLTELEKQPVNFGFNGLGEVVYRRTYSRLMEDGNRERFIDTIKRVVEGVMSIRKHYMKTHRLGWNENKMQQTAKTLAQSMYKLQFLPPGRGLWACGTKFMYRQGSMALNNCAGVVIRDDINRSIPWIMDCLMCGVGVGFRIEWSSKDHSEETPILVAPPAKTSVFVIEDSREGWVDSVRVLLESFLPEDREREPLLSSTTGYDRTCLPVFDYSKIRTKGEPIRGFGGISSGPDPLIKLHLRIYAYLDAYLEFLKDRNTGRRKLLKNLANIDAFYVMKREEMNIDSEFDFKEDYAHDLEFSRMISGLAWVNDNIPNIELGFLSIDDNQSFEDTRLCINKFLQTIDDTVWSKIVGNNNTNRWMEVINKCGLAADDYIIDDDGNSTEYFDILSNLDKDEAYDDVRLITDIVNAVGVGIVAGNVRRSAEIAMCSAKNETFRLLKNLKIFPERAPIAWMSNNSCIFSESNDFHTYIPAIAEQIASRGEPGFINMINIRNHGRVRPTVIRGDGKQFTREQEMDCAEVTNPCGEIPLESYELCNLAEVFISRCNGEDGKFSSDVFHAALKCAVFYTSTVTLLPTQYEFTNKVIARNRRTGVSLSGVVTTRAELGVARLIEELRRGYNIVREENRFLAREAGIPESIRVTTIKPSGTVSFLPGVPPGMHFPPFRYATRRVRIAKDNDLVTPLINAGIPYEEAMYDSNTWVFEFPIDHGESKDACDVSPWEQMSILELLQREWSDNMVSATISFPEDMSAAELADMIAEYAPKIKSCSLLPNRVGVYPQMPYSKLTKEQYLEQCEKLNPIQWDVINDIGEDTPLPRGCDGGICLTPSPDTF